MKKMIPAWLLSVICIIPQMVSAQNKTPDGLYSSREFRVVNSSIHTANASTRLNALNRASLNTTRVSERFEFPSQAPLTVYPNPAISGTRAVFTSRENGLPYNLLLVSGDGKIVWQRTGSTVAGTNTISLDLTGFTTGVYYLQLLVGERKELIRIMKVQR